MQKKTKNETKLKVAMLGGLNEIGKNMALLEYGDDMIIVDCGMGFPSDDMPGIDYIIPDFEYIEKNADKLRGIFVTHGHEDHIGGIPFLLDRVNVPVFATKLAIGILQNKLKEMKPDYEPTFVAVQAGEVVKTGAFAVEFIRVNHSIADACAFAIKTPVGTVVHTGDFKIDLTPVDGETMDIPRLAEIGRKGVLLLMCESTNVEKPGYTPSEKNVGQTLDLIFEQHKKQRIIIATFSSNVHRVQQIIDRSVAYKRKVVITGRSMLNIVAAAKELGYMSFPDGALIDIGEMKKYNPEQLTVISTGSQGEPMSGLYRMAYGEHDRITLGSQDLVVLSSHPIPGNEKLVNNIINEFCKKGISVYRDPTAEVHVSGHACQEEIKLMHTLLKPKFFMPIHGEATHLTAHRQLAMDLGMKSENIFVSEIGKVLELSARTATFAGVIPSGSIMVDGSGVGDVGSVVLRDRLHLAKDGLIVVVTVVNEYNMTVASGPDIVSRGFVYVKESEELINDLRDLAFEVVSDCLGAGNRDFNQIKNKLRDELSRSIYSKTRRKPMVLPLIMTV